MNTNSNLHQNKKHSKFRPKKFEIEIKTKLDKLLYALITVSFLVFISAFFYQVGLSDIVSPPTLITFGIFILIVITRRNSEEHFIVDKDKQGIMYRRKIFHWEMNNMFVHFNKISVVAAISQHITTGPGASGLIKAVDFWKYRTAILLHTGVVIPMGKWQTNYIKANSNAIKFAERTGIEFVSGEPKYYTVPVKLDGKYTFESRDTYPLHVADFSTEIAIFVITIVIILAIALFTY